MESGSVRSSLTYLVISVRNKMKSYEILIVGLGERFNLLGMDKKDKHPQKLDLKTISLKLDQANNINKRLSGTRSGHQERARSL